MKKIFQDLAIRRPHKRDRIYFGDFIRAFTSVKSVSCRLMEIWYPMHFMFGNIAINLNNYVSFKSKNDYKNNNSFKRLMDNVRLPKTIEEWDIELNAHASELFYFTILISQ